MIEQAGLEVRVQRRTDPAPANTVIDINRPPNSSVKKGFTVTIVVSSGPAQTKSELYPALRVSNFRFG
jgi:beta-lactam-binding protein with PASTA domain